MAESRRRNALFDAIGIAREYKGTAFYVDGEYLKTDEALENIAEFDRWLPSYAWITDVKKIDYLRWSKRTAIDEGENGF